MQGRSWCHDHTDNDRSQLETDVRLLVTKLACVRHASAISPWTTQHIIALWASVRGPMLFRSIQGVRHAGTGVQRNDSAHTLRFGECRFASGYVPVTRAARGDRPHEVLPPDTSEPTARLAPIDPDGRPMGTADEERVVAADRAQRGEARGCRSAEAASPDTATRSSGPAEYRPAPPPPPDVVEVQDDAADGRGQDGPRRAQRPRHADAAVGEAPQPDWTHFDIGNSVRALRTNNEAVIRRVLRKLHVRWWHASAQTLTRMLHRAGVPQKALDLVPSIVHSCTVCREWSRPGPTSASNSAIPDRFNEQVECDLIFISGHTILHMLDRCTRWHAAEVIPNKEASTLINGISRLWFQTHGPPKELIMDGEGGISGSDDAKLFLNHHGVRLVVRPKETHARYIERRGALFRDCVHRLVTQCNNDGLNVPFDRVLAEAVFAGNALLTVNGSTPYNAVYGRVPHVLPSADQLDYPEGATRIPDLLSTHRLRELAVQAVVEGSAQARISRALNTRTTMAGEQLNLQLGDEVDFFREPSTKDVSGWYGPATVVDLTNLSRGMITLRWLRGLYEVAIRHVRRHLSYFTLDLSYATYNSPVHRTVWSTVVRMVNQINEGTTINLGPEKTPSGWRRTVSPLSPQFRAEFLCAARFFGENHLQLDNVVAVKAGVGVRHIGGTHGHELCVSMMWPRGGGPYVFHEQVADHAGRIPRLSVQAAVGPCWAKLLRDPVLLQRGVCGPCRAAGPAQWCRSRRAHRRSPPTARRGCRQSQKSAAATWTRATGPGSLSFPSFLSMRTRRCSKFSRRSCWQARRERHAMREKRTAVWMPIG